MKGGFMRVAQNAMIHTGIMLLCYDTRVVIISLAPKFSMKATL